ncbi:MAG: hypothetical protein QOI17_484 [Gaiellales bacterium]|jgi:hypothetical protein|nr:hypothetical protein [Gaiellales bacterium]
MAAAVLLALLAFTPGRALPPKNIQDLRPWRPTLAIRFSGAMLSQGQPVSDVSDRHGFVTASIAGIRTSQLEQVKAAAATAARRVARTCRCRVRGYEVRARVPGRGVQVVASSS